MKKIGILGGTFNPPHFGHLLIAHEVLNELELDEIWFIPNKEPPHKKMEAPVSDEDRINMLRLAIDDEPLFKIKTIEMERKGPSYTYDTMKILKERYPDIHFYFIIGADMVESLSEWYKIEQLVDIVTFVGVDRLRFKLETSYPIIYVNVPNFEISSSDIRRRIKDGKTIKYLLPDSVISYIKEKKLYGAE